MDNLIECAGDPRTMGKCQGLAFRGAVRDALECGGVRLERSWLPGLMPLTAGRVLGEGAGREIIRHYTHLSERMAGIARGTGVSLEAVMTLSLAGSGSGAGRAGLLFPSVAALGGGAEAKGPVLARGLAARGDGALQWIVRKSCPEVGFRSVEVTLPWLASAVAGVNEEGVAVVVAPLGTASVEDGDLRGRAAGAGPGAELLVQECLQRFADLEGCIDWCSKRPASGELALILADASGGMAAVEMRGEERRVVGPGEGVLGRVAKGDLADELRAGQRAEGGSKLEGLADAIPDAAGGLVVLDSAQRSLCVALRSEGASAASLGLIQL
ncbi:MAG: hypothetical protein JRG96_06645 [Deltaproteobacteria bacterium]|nr:hypothetical protein [Deltaproteobacteria bacterium]MBW2420308.1 hypothetical protein [Deltaproteobacteria bacterium]